jgi:hypothetical protein
VIRRDRSHGWPQRRLAWLARDPEEICAAAHHEAAHAAVSALLGCTVQLVTIDPNLTAGGLGRCIVTAGGFEARLVGIVAARQWDVSCGWFPPRVVYETDRCIARDVATMLVDQQLGFAAPLTASAAQHAAVLRRARSEADRLLSLPETTARIHAVAAALMEAGTLRRWRICDLVGSSVRRRAL